MTMTSMTTPMSTEPPTFDLRIAIGSECAPAQPPPFSVNLPELLGAATATYPRDRSSITPDRRLGVALMGMAMTSRIAERSKGSSRRRPAVGEAVSVDCSDLVAISPKSKPEPHRNECENHAEYQNDEAR